MTTFDIIFHALAWPAVIGLAWSFKATFFASKDAKAARAAAKNAYESELDRCEKALWDALTSHSYPPDDCVAVLVILKHEAGLWLDAKGDANYGSATTQAYNAAAYLKELTAVLKDHYDPRIVKFRFFGTKRDWRGHFA